MDLHPYLFCLLFCLLYFFLPPFKDNGLLFWVPDVLCWHSEVVLWNLLSVYMFFWWICGRESGLPVLFLCHLRTPPRDCNIFKVVQFSSVAQLCPTLCDPMDCSTPGFPVLHHLPELAQTHVHWVDDATQPSHPLSCPFLLPSVFPSIRVFSNESVLCIRWPKYWSFSISPSNEYSGLISFRID